MSFSAFSIASEILCRKKDFKRLRELWTICFDTYNPDKSWQFCPLVEARAMLLAMYNFSKFLFWSLRSAISLLSRSQASSMSAIWYFCEIKFSLKMKFLQFSRFVLKIYRAEKAWCIEQITHNISSFSSEIDYKSEGCWVITLLWDFNYRFLN